MTVAFFGHRSVAITSVLQAKIFKAIEEYVREGATFYFGGYGEFDTACAHAVKKQRKIFLSLRAYL